MRFLLFFDGLPGATHHRDLQRANGFSYLMYDLATDSEDNITPEASVCQIRLFIKDPTTRFPTEHLP